MFRPLGGLVRRSLRSFGYDICWAHERRDPFEDMKRLAPASPLIFDVGANLGQTIARMHGTFKCSTIHAFEPGRIAFDALNKAYADNPHVALNNFALGAAQEMRLFREHARHNMSSFLETGAEAEIKDTLKLLHPVEISTVDDYCQSKGINKIDILKSDTQGFDLEVLKGAKQMMQTGKIDLVFIEVNFAQLYNGLPAVDEILLFLRECGFSLVAFYRFSYVNDRISWTDALFINNAKRT